MPSKYGQADIYGLENFSGIHYRRDKLDKYTDRVLNSVISMYEKEINTKVGSTFTGARGYQEAGLLGKRYDTASGLTVATPYYFKIDIDGAGVIEYMITTDATNVTYDGIIPLMNAYIDGAYFIIVNGDLRCVSTTIGTTSVIALTAGTTGTDLFVTLTGWSAFDTAVVGSGEIPDAIETLVIKLSYREMYNRMVWDGVMDRENPKKQLMPIWDDDLLGVLNPYIAKNKSPIRLIMIED